MIKGGGGALLREKIVAQASRREVIVADHTKLSERLGGGQDLIPSTLDKVYRIADLLASRDVSSVDGEVDGGIQEQTIGVAVSAGASVAVAGSAIFDATRPVAACVASLRDAARAGGPVSAACPRGPGRQGPADPLAVTGATTAVLHRKERHEPDAAPHESGQSIWLDDITRPLGTRAPRPATSPSTR